MTLEECRKHVGGRVVYEPSLSSVRPEYGTIERVNSTFVFVRYDRQQGAKATDPQYLMAA